MRKTIAVLMLCFLMFQPAISLAGIFISLPFKIILFVLADGWYPIVGSLML